VMAKTCYFIYVGKNLVIRDTAVTCYKIAELWPSISHLSTEGYKKSATIKSHRRNGKKQPPIAYLKSHFIVDIIIIPKDARVLLFTTSIVRF
jgi:hypothetical protein